MLALTSLALASPSGKVAPVNDQIRKVVRVLDNYQKWVDRRDYVRTSTTWREIVQLWDDLTVEQKETVERLRPGATDWLSCPDGYDGNGSACSP